ncbi:hypothetical protein [Streptomyces sp. NPDC048106]|uniref:hypothetical protein n=1 Tax=Streptomyces sp. NPDC048106 TaxID=3155750 RepID=UPI003451C666
MSAESETMVVAGILPLLYRITPAEVSQGPAGTATRNYLASTSTAAVGSRRPL